MATQQAPWTTGKHKPRPGRKRSASGVWGNTQRAWTQATRKHPWINLFLQILLGLIAVISLVLGAVLESALYYLVIGLAGLGALAIQRAKQMEQARQGAPAKPRPTTAGPRTPPPPSASSNPRPAAGPVKCTQTGKPIEGDAKCTCASRHIATEQGRQRYGGNIGDPIGKRTKPGKAAS